MSEKYDDVEHSTGAHNDASNDVQQIRAAEALMATKMEHEMSVWQCVKAYPKATAWSIAISMAVVMEGYDVVLLGNFYAYPRFVERFGEADAAGVYQIPARWQAGLSGAVNVGMIMGLILNGFVAERFGYRKTMIVSLLAMICLIFLFFFAQSLEMLLVAELLCGIPWGIFQTLTTSYAAEVAPVHLRGILTTWVNACWGIGQLIALGMLRGLLSRTDEWGWRIPYAVQWVWPIPLLIVIICAPESPWWLIRKGRREEARASLARLTRRGEMSSADLDNTVSMMEATHQMEVEATSGASYFDCFRGVDLRRTECTVGTWVVQQLCGSAFMNYSTYFFQQAGLSVESSFSLSMGQYAINTGGTFIAWGLIAWGIGRRAMYLYGSIWMCVVLLVVGGVSQIQTTAAAWAAGAMLLMWSVAYQFTVGTVCYSLVAELPSRRLLIKSINIGRALYCCVGIINGIIMPYMLNPTAWNWKGKTAFFWAGWCLVCCVWIFFRLPEPTGLTYAELDTCFMNRVPARQFGKHRAKAEQTVKQAVGDLETKADIGHIERS